MKKIIILALLGFILTGTSLYSQKEIPDSTLKKIDNCFQQRGEIYFKFKVFQLRELEFITRIISIANVDGNDVYAFANKNEFEKFKLLGYDFELLPAPYETATGIKTAKNLDELREWDVYPTYDQYIAMMTGFASQYPTLCRIVDAGNTVQGRKILFAVISKNVNTTEAEPKFMYTSTMHGNEPAGFVLMLRLIDYLLRNYSTNQEVRELVDNMEIWINPLANPDGTYKGNTINQAKRNNANNVDLNRNFPDPVAGDHPDGNPWQPETIIFMNVATQNYFTMSANFHSGVEVVNYPWDHKAMLTADNNWWVYVANQYAATVHSTIKRNCSGTISTARNSKIVNGTGTLFTAEIQTGDIITTLSRTTIGTVSTVTNNTTLTLVQNANINSTNISYGVLNPGLSGYENYFTYNTTGVINGFQWYEVHGGRQDYMIFFKRGRECTVELTVDYIPPADRLPAYWEMNYRSFLLYMRNALYGLTGIVRDSYTNEPVSAKITLNHDIDNSEVYSDALTGKYNRLLYAGTYTVTVTNPLYFTKTIPNVVITNGNTTNLDIYLDPIAAPVKLTSFTSNISGRDVKLNWVTEMEENNEGFFIEKTENRKQNLEWINAGFVKGNGTKNATTNYSFEDKNLQSGKYKYRLKQVDYNGNYEYFELSDIVEIGIPLKYDLSQNYPNPFNPVTKINFALPESGLVTLKVYDILGKEVASLVNEKKEAGYYTIDFDAGRLASGVYFYRLSVNGFSSVKRLVILK